MYVTNPAEYLSQPGVAAGLAVSEFGGSVLYVEATKMEGEGRLTLTGSLGSVMKESAKLALNWLRSHPDQVRVAYASICTDITGGFKCSLATA